MKVKSSSSSYTTINSVGLGLNLILLGRCVGGWAVPVGMMNSGGGPTLGTTRRGNQCLYWKDRKYVFDKSSSRKIYWRCMTFRQCKGRVHLTKEGLYSEIGTHSPHCLPRFTLPPIPDPRRRLGPLYAPRVLTAPVPVPPFHTHYHHQFSR